MGRSMLKTRKLLKIRPAKTKNTTKWRLTGTYLEHEILIY